MTPDLAALVDQYRAAREARRRAAETYRAKDTDDALAALQRAQRAEQHAAVCVAHTLAEKVEG